MINEKFNLEGKIAIVTGGSGFLGVTHCEALIELGALVFMADINQSSFNKYKSCYGNKLIPILMDITNEQAIQEVAKKIENDFGKLDILINNAAIDPKVKNNITTESSRLENFSLDQWNLEISVGLTGSMLCSKYFGKLMAKNHYGVILNIASDLSVIAPNQELYQKDGIEKSNQPVKPVTYSVIKSGLIGLTKYLATYYADSNVRVNALSPGGVFDDQDKNFVTKLKKLIPMKRMADRNEYQSAVQFLCSDASSYMTGQNVVIDGGRSVW